ncbi:unnamed protein product [Rhizopus microsporus]
MRNTIVWATILLSLGKSEKQPGVSTAGALRIIDQTDNSTIESNTTAPEQRFRLLPEFDKQHREKRRRLHV